MRSSFRSRLPVLLAVLFVVLLVLFAISGRIVEWLWMEALGYEAVFWKLWWTKASLFFSGFFLTGLFFGANFFLLFREVPMIVRSTGELTFGLPGGGDLYLTRRHLRWVMLGIGAFFSILFGAHIASHWDNFLRFGESTPYGEVDPIFGNDLSFYLLELPFVEAIQGTMLGVSILGVVLVGAGYVILGRITMEHRRVLIPRSVTRHFTFNVLLVLVALAWGFYLDRYALLYASNGAVFGVGYVDEHTKIPGLWASLIATLLLIFLVATNLFKARPRLLLAGIGLYGVGLLAATLIIPALIRQVTVEPNELQLETPYLEHNIRFTRLAYGIDDIEERAYSAEQELTQADVAENELALQNIRLWDPRLLIQTFRQIQEIRSYYQFYNVDVDRYVIDSTYLQVMVAARELSQQLPERSDTWVNRHLQYTHGYGVTMNLVSQEGEEGTPTLLVQDLPPVVTVSGLDIDQAAIYYGEQTPTYRIVNSEVPELHYPRGDDNVYTSYEGRGGVLLNSFWRELLFAWYLSDFNFLLSGYIKDDSRIQFWNRVQERIYRIAPFLQLDADPYLVIHDGRLVWVQDAYTTASTFPYAERTRGGLNYIRNSVKVVVDAYHGSVDFYVTQPEDPVLEVYSRAFPELFQPLEAMDEGLQRHLRYPMDLFLMQIEKLRRYHMEIPQVFYNNEDLWTRPREKYGGQVQMLEPYYVLTRLPGERTLQYMLMTPLTPENRDNMIAWVAAKSDMPDYGQLVLYSLPKDKLVYGPNQVEAMIDQNTLISQQLSLWDQSGSRVIRGNLIAVPIADAFVYVEPVFLIGEGNEIPQLQRVIVSDGQRVAMQPTLEEALRDLLGGSDAPRPDDGGDFLPVPTGDGSAALQQARRTFNQLERAFRNGDFQEFGEALEALRRALNTPTPAPVDTAGQF